MRVSLTLYARALRCVAGVRASEKLATQEESVTRGAWSRPRHASRYTAVNAQRSWVAALARIVEWGLTHARPSYRALDKAVGGVGSRCSAGGSPYAQIACCLGLAGVYPTTLDAAAHPHNRA